MISHASATHRAIRFGLALPVRYRRAGDRDWGQGTSINISRSGLLFAPAGHAVCPGDQIEFCIQLPAHRRRSGGEARCSGRVVRVSRALTDGAQAVVAVSIDRYMLARQSQGGAWSADSGRQDREIGRLQEEENGDE